MTALGDMVGPYRCTEVLGEGGMGVVYRGEHIGGGAPAAVKTVRAADVATLDAIRREIRALGRVQHPGIVRILAEGVDDGLPWYAMELVLGRTLRATLQDRTRKGEVADKTVAMETDEPELARTTSMEPSISGEGGWPARGPAMSSMRGPAPPFERALAVLHDLCDALAHLHAAGLVHRDLKPENVIVRPDDTPALMDLGIAGTFGGAAGREEVAFDLRVMGSFAYMAPEQIRGEATDARTDLYALGCILYEALTGRPPFLVDSSRSVLSAHLRTRPIPPGEMVSGVPRQLDALTMRLLAKEPRDRPGYAADVAAALRPFVTPSRAVAPRVPAPAYVYRPQLIGRRGSLARLHAALDTLCAGTGGLVLVGGESGAGKTRLVSEAARAAVRRDVLVVSGQSTARLTADRSVPSGVPFEPVRPLLAAIADRVRDAGDEATRRVFGGRAALLAPYEPAVAGVAAALDEAPPPDLPPDAAKARVIRALVEAVGAFAETVPLLWVTDDLQWADELTLVFLKALAERAHEGRAWLTVGTFRSEEVQPALASLLASPDAMRIDLDRFAKDDIREMVSGMLAIDRPPEALVEFLTGASSGNPFFLGEYLRAAMDEGLLARDETGSFSIDDRAASRIASGISLPGTLAALLERRLSSLDAAALRMAEAASVLGREVPTAWLAAVSGLGADAVLDAVQALRVRHVLEEAAPGTQRFVHDKLRESAYSRIAAHERTRLHRKAAATIEANGADAPEHAAALAHHLAHGGEPARAAAAYERAADRAAAAYANEQAVALYRAALAQIERALAGADGDAETRSSSTPRVSERLGDVLGIDGKHDEARAAYDGALSAMGPASGRGAELAQVGRARLSRKAGKTLEIQHRHAEALERYRGALHALGPHAPAGDEAWWAEWIAGHVDQVSSHYWQGHKGEMSALITRVRPTVEEHATPLVRMRFFQALTQLHTSLERYQPSDTTIGYARACLLSAEEAGDEGDLANVVFGVATVFLLGERLDEAEAQMKRALALAKQRGNRPVEARCLAYLATIVRRRGLTPDVERFAASAIEAAAAGGAPIYAGAAQGHLAWVAGTAKRWDDVIAFGQTALGAWSTPQYVYPFQWIARLPMIAAYLSKGRPDEAAAQARLLLDRSQQAFPADVEGALRDLASSPGDHVEAALRTLTSFDHL